MKKIICMVLESNFPPDIRVEKEANALIKSGYEVFVLCMKQTSKPDVENWKNIQIYRIFPHLSVFARLYSHLFFRHPTIKAAVYNFLNVHQVDALHVHDLPLAKTILKIARPQGIASVVDFHENYPAAIGAWRNYSKGFKNFFVKYLNTYRRWLAQERWVVKKADRIIVVVDEMKETLCKRSSVSPDQVFVVTNTEERSFIKPQTEHENLRESYENNFTLLYSGGIGPHRGIDTTIKSLPHLMKLIPEVKLILVGTGDKDYLSHLHKLAEELKVEQLIEWVGWQPFDKMFGFMKACDLGLIPHNFNEHTDNTIPHKLFQNMMVGLPAVVSDCRPLARIIQETSAGSIFKADDPISLANVIYAIYKNPELKKKMSDAGIAATLNGKYMWESTSKILVSMYNDLLK